MKDNERMLISAHFDGEVEEPWKTQVEAKIAGDSAWSAEAALQQRLRAVLAASVEPDFTAARSRVAEKLKQPRVLSQPLPLGWLSIAAAALLVLAAGGGFWFGRQSASGPAEVSELQVQVPAQLELKLSGEGQLFMASTLQGTRR